MLNIGLVILVLDSNLNSCSLCTQQTVNLREEFMLRTARLAPKTLAVTLTMATETPTTSKAKSVLIISGPIWPSLILVWPAKLLKESTGLSSAVIIGMEVHHYLWGRASIACRHLVLKRVIA